MDPAEPMNISENAAESMNISENAAEPMNISENAAEPMNISVIPANIDDRFNDADAQCILLTLPAAERLARKVEFAYYANYCKYAKFADNAINFDKLDGELPQARDVLNIPHRTIMTAHYSNIHTSYAYIAEHAEYAIYATYSDNAKVANEYWISDDEIDS